MNKKDFEKARDKQLERIEKLLPVEENYPPLYPDGENQKSVKQWMLVIFWLLVFNFVFTIGIVLKVIWGVQ